MKLNKVAVVLPLSIVSIVTVMWWNEMNVFWSHPIVSGSIMVVIASIIIPHRIEAEKKKVLENGFYDDLSFVLHRYKITMNRVIECASTRLHANAPAVGEILVGNECIKNARLNMNLALSNDQKEALILIENAIDVTNRNLDINIKKLQRSIEINKSGFHDEINMKAAAQTICHIIYTLSKCIEQKERYRRVDVDDKEVYSAAIYALLGGNREKMDLIMRWMLTDETLPINKF